MTSQIAITFNEPLEAAAPEFPRAAVVQPHVLCATDLSPQSQRAVARAVLLANELDGQLTLLHVVKPGEQSDADEQMAQLSRSIRAHAHREPVIRLHTGEYVPSIATIAQETAADLIIIGPQRRKPFAPLVGTTAERLTQLSGRPVLIVNRDSRARYDAVVVAAELSDAFRQVIRTAGSLRLLKAPSVSVVHGFESPYRGPLYAEGFDLRAAQRNIEEWERAARKRLQQNLDAAGVESAHFRLIFQQSQPLRAIQRVIRSVEPELLIVGTKNRSILNRLMRGSVANDSLRSIECDILVAPLGMSSTVVLQ